MADKPINDLNPASVPFGADDLFVLQQGGQAKKVKWQNLATAIAGAYNGFGGVTEITGPVKNGLVDKYTMHFAIGDPASAVDFYVTNGNGITNVTGPVQDQSNPLKKGYTLVFDDTTKNKTYYVFDGNGIDHISGPVATGLNDEYTIHYTSGGTSTFTVKNGKGIVSQTTYWATNDDPVNAPSVQEFSTTVPTLNPTTNKYLWRYISTVYNDSQTPVDSDAVVVGVYGDTGATGATGAASEITEQIVEYAVGGTDGSQPISGWGESIPDVAPGFYLWTRTTLEFNDETNVVFYSKARQGINGEGSVESVNGVAPDSEGNVQLTYSDIGQVVTSVNGQSGEVALTRVPLADNLFSPDNQEQYDDFIFRTSGGTVSIESGDAHLVLIAGNMNIAGRVAESVSVSSSNSDVSVSVDAAVWRVSTLGQASGTYMFTYSSGNWTYGGQTVSLLNFGITATVVEGGSLSDGDAITVYYTKEERGTITIPTPTAFKSIGLNQFDKANNILSGYTIDGSGNVVSGSGYVAWVHVVGGLEMRYTVYPRSTGVVSRIGYLPSIPTTSTIGIALLTAAQSSFGDAYTVPVAADGYLCIATTDIDNLCVHPSWSGYEDGTYEEYTEDIINLPMTADDDEHTPLPISTYGMPRVAGVYDVLNLDQKTYIKRIGRLENTAQNLENVRQMGVAYDYDAAYIYYVLPSEVTYPLASTVSDLYQVADFGTEEFLGTSVSVYAETLYGYNLRDKLRTDVLTKSPQTLSDSQKIQVLDNIGLYDYFIGSEFGDVAESSHTAGRSFIWKNIFVKALTDIAIGDTLSMETNGNVSRTYFNGFPNSIPERTKSGSDYAWRFPNGFMICCGEFSVQAASTSEWESFAGGYRFEKIVNHAFSYAFTDTPALCGFNTGGTYGGFIRAQRSATQIAKVEFFRNQASTNVLWFSYIAMGTWR